MKPPFTPNFEPELEWAWTGSPIMPDYKQVAMTPVVVDVNGDGVPDVVFNTYSENGRIGRFPWSDGVMRAISGADGSDLWTVTDPAYHIGGAANIAAGDIDGDGKVELCTIPSGNQGVICFENDGTFKFRTAANSDNNWGGPSLADLDGDGTVEIINGNTVYSNTGALKWQGSEGTGGPQDFPDNLTGPLSFAVDIDQAPDHKLEVVNGGTIYRADGTVKCTNKEIANGLAAVGNFDSDPQGEVVVVLNGYVTLMDDNCQTLWSVPIPGGGEGGPPNIADFDNDGQPEIGVAGKSFYAVFETNGTLRWQMPTVDLSSHRTGSSTFDFDGDGKAEVVYADEQHLHIYDGTTGNERATLPHSSCTAYENPVVVDVDGDNNAEIVTATNVTCYNGQYAGIRVYRDKKDGWVNTRRIWNQHAYSVTNVNEDGTIPRYPATNWTTPGLNTFRTNSQGSGGTSVFAAADLMASDVAASCDSASQGVVLTARVRNGGDAAASAGLPVAFYRGNPASGGTLLGVAHVQSVLAAGAEAWVTLQFTHAPGGQAEVWAVADDDGTGQGRELECHEDNNAASAPVSLECSGCMELSLRDYNLFLLEDYTGGHDVEGKVAAGGNISMTDFAVGTAVPAGDIANTLVAGGNLTLSRGGVWGDARYGGHYDTQSSVVFPRGAAAQGTPIDFAARGAKLRQLSAQLASMTATGSTRREGWGGLFLSGNRSSVNVFDLDASAITGAKQLSIEAPAGSLAVVNIRGGSATFTGFGITFSGGIDQHGVLYNFVDATRIDAYGFGFWGTVLAPSARIFFNDGSWDGGIYATSLTGSAEGHINALADHTLCQ